MPRELSWDNPEELGITLYEQRPETDPLAVRFTDVHRWVIELEGFTGDPAKSNEAKLEAIQMAWYEEWKDNQ